MRKNLYLLSSYPKSGNTWLRVLILNLMKATEEPSNINQLPGEIASSRVIFEQMVGINSEDLSDSEIFSLRARSLKAYVDRQPRPSIFKIHDLLVPPGKRAALVPVRQVGGAVYIIRNPLDVCVSYAHHMSASMEQTVKIMNNPRAAVNPRIKNGMPSSINLLQPLGTWSQHILSWTTNLKFPTVIIRYEDMHADTEKMFVTVAAFLQLATTPEAVRRAVANASFSVLRDQEASHGFHEKPKKMKSFFRKGKIGSWREELPDAQAAQIIADHGDVMKRFGYLDSQGNPVF
jgi:hypothetical protein